MSLNVKHAINIIIMAMVDVFKFHNISIGSMIFIVVIDVKRRMICMHCLHGMEKEILLLIEFSHSPIICVCNKSIEVLYFVLLLIIKCIFSDKISFFLFNFSMITYTEYMIIIAFYTIRNPH